MSTKFEPLGRRPVIAETKPLERTTPLVQAPTVETPKPSSAFDAAKPGPAVALEARQATTSAAPSASASALWPATVAPLKPFAKEIVKRAIANTADLVRIRSQGGIDDPAAIVAELKKKVESAGLVPEVLFDPAGKPVGVTAELKGAHPGPTFVLNAVSDTAPVGDPARWSKDPFGAEIVGNKMYGRGTADSKFAAAMFLEIARDLSTQQQNMKGSLVLFFDAAEHTGKFEGVRSFLEKYPKPDGVMIGYPGDDAVYIGSRGFFRSHLTARPAAGDAEAVVTALRTTGRLDLPKADKEAAFPLGPKVTPTAVATREQTLVDTPNHVSFAVNVAGKAVHSGSSTTPGVNAITKTAHVLEKLSALAAEKFGSSPIVSSVNGGIDYALVPDKMEVSLTLPATPAGLARTLLEAALADADQTFDAGAKSAITSETKSEPQTKAASALEMNVDMRVVPNFDGKAAEAELRRAMSSGEGSRLSFSLQPTETWPAFQLQQGDPLRDALVRAVNLPREGMKPIPARVSGPSNIGNLLASHGISATSGYGIESSGAHVPDEWIDLSTAPQVMHNIRVAVRDLMGVDDAK